MKSTRTSLSPCLIQRIVLTLLPIGAALTLTGCWTPPNAHVPPPGEPRLIQSGVTAEANHVLATVQAVDAGQQGLRLKLADGTLINCIISPQLKDIGQLQAGDRVKVTLAEKLAVYVLKEGRLPVAGGTDEVVPFIAKVQVVDPSYRLLTLQYVNGQTQILKADLAAKLLEMQPGDAVVLESAEVTALQIEK